MMSVCERDVLAFTGAQQSVFQCVSHPRVTVAADTPKLGTSDVKHDGDTGPPIEYLLAGKVIDRISIVLSDPQPGS